MTEALHYWRAIKADLAAFNDDTSHLFELTLEYFSQDGRGESELAAFSRVLGRTSHDGRQPAPGQAATLS